MSKKNKCIKCGCSMHWALPERVTNRNIEYAKQCLDIARKTVVCGETMRTKDVGHEQYCKKFKPKTDFDLRMDDIHQTEIAHLEEIINTYESQQN